MPDVYEYRKKGKALCETEGSDHYKSPEEVEPIDLIVSNKMIEPFALASIIKYASRYSRTKNLKDLQKIADYAHILAGVNHGKN